VGEGSILLIQEVENTMPNDHKHDSVGDASKELWEKIKDVRIAMLTTADTDGRLHSRPMATQSGEFDGNLWFFTYEDSPKIDQVKDNPQVCLSYAAPDKDLYVWVSGKGELVHDKAKAEELWNPFAKAWFPDGLEDPRLALLKVEIEQAEYWSDNQPKALQIPRILTSAVTGKPHDPGEDKKIDLQSGSVQDIHS
jgi:general stress protein 26